MSYYKDDEGIVYYEAYESPSAVYSVEEWAVEKERLIASLTSQINSLQNQIDNKEKPIEIEENYPDDVKALIEEHNAMLLGEDTEYIENQIIKKQALLDEITNL